MLIKGISCIYVLLFILCLNSCINPSNKPQQVRETLTDSISITTFYTDSIGWGYDIYINSKKVIHQPHIPVINGMKGFQDETDAYKVAKLVSKKLKKGILPPTITLKELYELKVTTAL